MSSEHNAPAARPRERQTDAVYETYANDVHQETLTKLVKTVDAELVKNLKFVRRMIAVVLSVFLIFNGALLWAIYSLWRYDQAQAAQNPEYPRLITTTVITALVAAFAGQLGALAFAVGSKALELQSTLVSQLGAVLKSGHDAGKTRD